MFRRVGIILAWIGVAGGLLLWLWRDEARPVDRVVVLGFDGVAPNLLDPLIAAGALPNLRGVIERGVYGRLRTSGP